MGFHTQVDVASQPPSALKSSFWSSHGGDEDNGLDIVRIVEFADNT
jgi:hypothetical protein